MKFKIILIMVFLSSFMYGINLKDTLKYNYPNRFVIGSKSSMFYANIVGPDDKEYIFYQYRLEPSLSVYLNMNLGFGIQGYYEHGINNYGAIIPKLYGLGVFVRYYYPLKFKNIGKKDRFKLYCELGYLKVNYYMLSVKSQPVILDKCDARVFNMPIGVSIRFWRGFHGKIEVRPEFYKPGANILIYQLGIEYHV